MTGRFITLEGGEGTGKSTQARLLAIALRARGQRVLITREPGGSPRAEAIRAFLLTGRAERHGPFGEAVLFAAARIDHLRSRIEPALERGDWVVCDRFSDSTRVYQGVIGGLDLGLLDALDRAVLGATRPDLTLILDCPAEIGLARAASRRDGAGAPDRFERAPEDVHRRIREAFLDIARAEPGRCAVVDAAQDEDSVHDALLQAVTERMSNGAAPRSTATVPEQAAS